MFQRVLRQGLAACVMVLACAAVSNTAKAETLAGTDVESRIIVGLSVDTDTLSSMLPDGWTPTAFSRGPLKGANYLVSFIDGHVALDADGNPRSPGSRRAVSLVSLVTQDGGDEVRLYLTGIYAAADEDDPYGLKASADISRHHALYGPADGGRQSTENWTVITENGGELSMSLEFTIGKRGWSLSESKVYSAANPDFFATYRWDSVTDVVMSDAMEKPLSGSFNLNNTVPELASIFDGNEKLIAILDIPVRVRKTFYP